MSFLILLLICLAILAAVAVPVAIRDRRRTPANHADRGDRRGHPTQYGHNGAGAFDVGGVGGGFDGGGGGGDGGGGS